MGSKAPLLHSFKKKPIQRKARGLHEWNLKGKQEKSAKSVKRETPLSLRTTNSDHYSITAALRSTIAEHYPCIKQ
jgi:hypothetical protein